MPGAQPQEVRDPVSLERGGAIDIQRQALGEVPLDSVAGLGGERPGQPLDGRQLPVLPGARVAAGRKPSSPHSNQLEPLRRCGLVEGVAQSRLVRGPHRSLERGGNRRVLLKHRRLVGLFQRVERRALREDASRPGEANPYQVDPRIGGLKLLEALPHLVEGRACECPLQAAVDQHQAVDVLEAGAAVEVPGGVGNRRRGTERVTAQDHLARAPGASRQDHASEVAQGEVEPPLARERKVLAAEEPKSPAVDRLEPQVVGEGLVSVARSEHGGVFQRVRPPVNRPDLKVGHTRDDVAGNQPEVSGAADESRDQHKHPARLGRPDLVDEDAVEELGPGARRALDRDVARRDRRRPTTI